MNTIPQSCGDDNLPVGEINAKLETFLEPVLAQMPEKRLREMLKLAVQGIMCGQSPLITRIARGVAHHEDTVCLMAKRLYRLAAEGRNGSPWAIRR